MHDPFPFSAPPRWQHTLGKTVPCEGIGLHTGIEVRLSLGPAPADAGLVFMRKDGPHRSASIALHPRAVCQTRRGTSIGNVDGVTLATTEHLLAALAACGIDNAVIEVSGPEIPAMDGSALAFATLIKEAVPVSQNIPRRYIEVLKAITCLDGNRQVSLKPSTIPKISARIDYPDTLIGEQSYHFDVTATGFIKDIAPARTFALAHEIKGLKEAGLALGGSLDNCILVDGMTIQNPDNLRFYDEFVRHKILDILGDLALAGAPVLGHFISDCAGHSLNNTLIRTLMDDPDAWRWKTFTESPDKTTL
ncbi:MAG: UDP-3-O-[3-hydroxymyristoyl] N-acetylglucosamine deacetylase [Robiginitomaculum sp.]|nr:MAG: UDP-3-O-[3-hydroxymyristoyl] N-acetylglucosamine deacetylase [Robiginitomaculum sp.]